MKRKKLSKLRKSLSRRIKTIMVKRIKMRMTQKPKMTKKMSKRKMVKTRKVTATKKMITEAINL